MLWPRMLYLKRTILYHIAQNRLLNLGVYPLFRCPCRNPWSPASHGVKRLWHFLTKKQDRKKMMRISLVFTREQAVAEKNTSVFQIYFRSDTVGILKSTGYWLLCDRTLWVAALLSEDKLTVVEKFICPDEKRVWAGFACFVLLKK